MVHKLKFIIIVGILSTIGTRTSNKVAARMLMREDLEPTGIVTRDVPTNKKIIGFRIQQAPQLVKTVLNKGHEIGNHTMNHVFAQNTPLKMVQKDILEGQKYIEKWNKDPLLYRPPGGYINYTVFTTVKQQGKQIVLWSWHQDSRDWPNPEVTAIANHV